MFEIEDDNYLEHYGILRKSGRYPWGSGSNPEARSKDFFSSLALLRSKGLTDQQIAEGWGMTTTQLRQTNSLAKNAKKSADIAMAQKLKDKNYSNVAIGKRMGIRESSVRSLLAPGVKEKNEILGAVTAMLRKEVDERGYLDVGTGVEQHMGLSKEKLGSALAILKGEDYVVTNVQVDQLGTGGGKKTTVKVLAPPGTTYRELATNTDKIQSITKMSDNGGRSFYGILPPLSVSAKRVGVVYKEEGGADADGVIYVRPGVKDVSLGKNHYAQVRIAVEGSHYLKGMAIYKEDLPAGVDLVFNTNKSNTGNKLDAMKKLSDDPDNPFGAVIKQIGDMDADGRVTKLTSAVNIVNPEGKWETWKKSLSSQVLSKQTPKLAKQQLDQKFLQSKESLEEILALSNPAVREKLLQSFSDAADSSAVALDAAALPRQRTQVLLPMASLKPTEVYAPNFRNGERVALVRYPHGGKFEIPELVVNNRHAESRRLLGDQVKDAIAINPKVASKLSGADFDGDTVLVIPNNTGALKSESSLSGLKNFDPQSSYRRYDGMKTIDGGTWNAAANKIEYPEGKSSSPRGKGTQMGLVSNLITDMTIKGASNAELAAAVRHSMVVIDAEKHVLDYKRSSVENGIPALMKKYQNRSTGGAATLISKATSRTEVNKRDPRSAADGGAIDKDTGKLVFKDRDPYVNAKGQTVFRKERSVKLKETDDAFSLIDGTGTPMERIYADHSNRMKDLANQARKEMVNTKPIPYSPSAKKVYDAEVKKLDADLNLAIKNRPRERQAQILANNTVALKRQAKPDMDDAELKKVKAQALDEARVRTGAKKPLVPISERQWEAIQAGAVSHYKLRQILANADIETVKALATPRTQVLMTNTKLARAKLLINAGYTQAEIADQLGVSLTTLKDELAKG